MSLLPSDIFRPVPVLMASTPAIMIVGTLVSLIPVSASYLSPRPWLQTSQIMAGWELLLWLLVFSIIVVISFSRSKFSFTSTIEPITANFYVFLLLCFQALLKYGVSLELIALPNGDIKVIFATMICALLIYPGADAVTLRLTSVLWVLGSLINLVLHLVNGASGVKHLIESAELVCLSWLWLHVPTDNKSARTIEMRHVTLARYVSAGHVMLQLSLHGMQLPLGTAQIVPMHCALIILCGLLVDIFLLLRDAHRMALPDSGTAVVGSALSLSVAESSLQDWKLLAAACQSKMSLPKHDRQSLQAQAVLEVAQDMWVHNLLLMEDGNQLRNEELPSVVTLQPFLESLWSEKEITWRSENGLPAVVKIQLQQVSLFLALFSRFLETHGDNRNNWMLQVEFEPEAKLLQCTASPGTHRRAQWQNNASLSHLTTLASLRHVANLFRFRLLLQREGNVEVQFPMEEVLLPASSLLCGDLSPAEHPGACTLLIDRDAHAALTIANAMQALGCHLHVISTWEMLRQDPTEQPWKLLDLIYVSVSCLQDSQNVDFLLALPCKVIVLGSPNDWCHLPPSCQDLRRLRKPIVQREVVKTYWQSMVPVADVITDTESDDVVDSEESNLPPTELTVTVVEYYGPNARHCATCLRQWGLAAIFLSINGVADLEDAVSSSASSLLFIDCFHPSCDVYKWLQEEGTSNLPQRWKVVGIREANEHAYISDAQWIAAGMVMVLRRPLTASAVRMALFAAGSKVV